MNDFYIVTDYCGQYLLMWETNWLLIDSSLLKTDSNSLFSDSNEWFL
jgi:hypothetical protein